MMTNNEQTKSIFSVTTLILTVFVTLACAHIQKSTSVTQKRLGTRNIDSSNPNNIVYLHPRARGLQELQPNNMVYFEASSPKPGVSDFLSSAGFRFIKHDQRPGIWSDKNQTSLRIKKPFLIMEKEVTQRQWVLIMGRNPSSFSRPGDCNNRENINGEYVCPDHPVENVSFDEVGRFIETLNNSLGLRGFDCSITTTHTSSNIGCFRLPTDVEWEWAVRAGTTTVYFFEDDPSTTEEFIRGRTKLGLRDYAWYYENSGRRTHKVGLKKANPWGLYDVYGNVSEMVVNRAVHLNELSHGGGSWISSPQQARSATSEKRNRYKDLDYKGPELGFRLMKELR